MLFTYVYIFAGRDYEGTIGAAIVLTAKFRQHHQSTWHMLWLQTEQ